MAEFSILEAKRHDIYPAIDPTKGLKGAAKDQIVLITGAGTGIGKATAKAFAQAGAKTIIITGRRIEPLQGVKAALEPEFQGLQVVVESIDVSSEEAVDGLFSKLGHQGIEVDILINNAGIDNAYGQLKHIDIKAWWSNFEIMVKGPFLMTRAFFKARKSTSHGVVIMTSSIGSYCRMPGFSSYSACKAALNRVTEWVALEGKEQNVTAIAYHPGGVPDTDITSKSPDFMLKYYTDTAELGAGTTVYLARPQAAWLSGRYVDAGWDVEELESARERIEKDDLLQMGLLGAIGFREKICRYHS